MQQTNKTWEEERSDFQQKYKERGQSLRDKKEKDNTVKINDKGEKFVEGFGRVKM